MISPAFFIVNQNSFPFPAFAGEEEGDKYDGEDEEDCLEHRGYLKMTLWIMTLTIILK